MQWLWWFVGAMALGIVEVFTLDLTFAMLAGGALAAGGVALFGVEWWVSAIVFAVVSALLFVLLRPYLITVLRIKSPLVEMNSNALVGREARTIDEVTETSGRVKLNGEVWSARTPDDAPVIPEGSEVTVVAISGATAIVAPEKE
ncbi:NfeD family protein [Demequina oxidasica]|uniref:NfeD family protein n=1 Tax=Demequina oxidasica TaxID=676199 RepID=UPI000784FFDA|nr:NfeD family protein [Demequina oxidasica]